jgi:type VI protein secretion system component VasF
MKRDEVLIQRVRDRLEQETEHMDYATQLALRQAREKALAQVSSAEDAVADTRGLSWGLPWKMMAGAAASIMIALTLWWQPIASENESITQEPAMYADLDLLATEEPIELYQELDFYLWLDEENETISA